MAKIKAVIAHIFLEIFFSLFLELLDLKNCSHWILALDFLRIAMLLAIASNYPKNSGRGGE